MKPGQRERITGLAGLGRLREQLEAEARRRAEAERLAAAEAEAKRRQAEAAAREANLFRHAVGEVRPLPDQGRTEPYRPHPVPVALQHMRDERAALSQSLSDEFDVDSLLETDETLHFRREGIGPDVISKLRRGHWVIQDQIDLHGCRTDEAREALGLFLKDCLKVGRRCVRVVHGKGLGSRDRQPVLKGKVRSWLVQRDEVLAFCQARPEEGGSGALVVLLRPGRHSRTA